MTRYSQRTGLGSWMRRARRAQQQPQPDPQPQMNETQKSPPASSAVTPKPKPSAQPTSIRGLLEGEAFKTAVSKALPRHLPPDRFIRIALTALMRTPKLADCDQGSFFQALLSLSQLGLEPDGRRAHLIPFENRKRGVTECQLIVDYKGLVELAMRSGVVSNLHADLVRENDEFDFDRGQLLHHRINFREDRGNVFAVYAICRFKDGQEKCEVMTKAEVEAIRARSRAGNSGPWVTDWNEMAKKTVFRRLTKWLPLSAEFRDALDADGEHAEDQRFNAAKPVFDATSFLPQASSAPVPMVAAPTPAVDQVEEDVLPDERSLPPEPEPSAAPTPTAHQKLAALLDENGITFQRLHTWAAETQWEPGFDAYASIDELPLRSAVRLLNAKSGLIKMLGARTPNTATP